MEKGLTAEDYERKRAYPNNERDLDKRSNSVSQGSSPLLAKLISLLSPSASISDLLNAGHTLLIISAGLTSLMIILAFGAAGYWLEGTIASIGSGLSTSYLVRSSFGRIDTDQLNLGLFYLMFGLILLASRSQSQFIAFFCGACGLDS